MTYDEAKVALLSIGATPIAQMIHSLQAQVEDAAKKAVVLEERLKQAMAREAEQKTALTEATRERDQLKAQMAQYEAHPEVREAKRKRLLEQAAQLAKQAESLAPAEEQ